MRLRQFLSDLALLPDIWRDAVGRARARIEMARKIAIKDAFKLAERELAAYQGPKDGPAWDVKIATHTAAKRDYEVAWAAEIRSAEIFRLYARRPRATPSLVPSTRPIDQAIRHEPDGLHLPEHPGLQRGSDLQGTPRDTKAPDDLGVSQ